MSHTGYSTITKGYPITHTLTQRTEILRTIPRPLFEGQDFSDLHHALLDASTTPTLSYNTSQVSDGYLLIRSGADGVVYDSTGKVVRESALWADRTFERISLTELKATARPLDQAIFVGIDPGWWTYYHWVVISLSRIGMYFNTFDYGATVAIAPYRDDGRMRFTRDVWSESLGLVAPRDRLLILEDGIYHAPRIGLSWIDFPQQAFVSYFDAFRSTMAIMRDRVGLLEVAHRDRIILFRDSDERLAEPSKEALQRLIDQDGFTVARLERMSLADQARIFAGAACIIAPHGAGLCNILYGKPSLKVLEFNTEYDGPYVRPWFYLLAAIQNQTYAYLNQTRSTFNAIQIYDMAQDFVNR